MSAATLSLRDEGLVCAVRHLLWLLAEGLEEDGSPPPEEVISAAALALEHLETVGGSLPKMTSEGLEIVVRALRELCEADRADLAHPGFEPAPVVSP